MKSPDFPSAVAVPLPRRFLRLIATLSCSHTFAFFTAGMSLTLATAPALHAQVSTGVIEGRVFNAATGNALVNARITLVGTNRETVTDESGSYRLAGVPAGTTDLRVLYLGMEAQTTTVQVPGNGTITREFELRLDRGSQPSRAADNIVELDVFRVVVDREMSAQAIAMNEQRLSPNIKNVVAIDEFGDRGNENIGEFLLFLPGVSIETSGSEPTTVSFET